MNMSNKTVLVQKDRRICTVLLNRPEVMNAINHDFIEDFENAFTQIAKDEEIRVVILEGAGANFCAGADMSWLDTQSGAPEMFHATKRFGRIILTIRQLPQPVINKVRGYAVGGGANLALSGDFVVVSQNARFIQAFVNLGVVLDGGGTYLLPRLVGPVKARELALLGDVVDGESAADLGLVYKCVPDEELDGEVASLASTLSEKTLGAMSLIKEGIETSVEMSLSEVIEWEASHQAVMLQTEEHKAAVKQFLRSRGKAK
jgi:2-(1,2-epoxy-1,2-dihydrophenyl)acetyl-CoA isomerase